MTSDKDPQILEEHLMILGSKIRIAILQYLGDDNILRDFRDIEAYLQTLFSDSFKLSYHLKKLEEYNYLEKTKKGYELTQQGHKTLPVISNFHAILTDQTPIYIRTSKYSLEPFQESIIVQNLVQEAEMSLNQAKIIAREARKRLADAKVTYLTAPLIREYVNAILIEHHLEDYRHKLTRLGLPPFDITKALNSHSFLNPGEITHFLGQNMWEQYTLLNILNQNYADLFLSGDIILGNLAHFSLTSMECILSGISLREQLNVYLESSLSPFSGQTDLRNIFDLSITEFAYCVNQFFHLIKPFYPNGLVILRFDEFLYDFLDSFSEKQLELLWTQVFLPFAD